MTHLPRWAGGSPKKGWRETMHRPRRHPTIPLTEYVTARIRFAPWGRSRNEGRGSASKGACHPPILPAVYPSVYRTQEISPGIKYSPTHRRMANKLVCACKV